MAGTTCVGNCFEVNDGVLDLLVSSTQDMRIQWHNDAGGNVIGCSTGPRDFAPVFCNGNDGLQTMPLPCLVQGSGSPNALEGGIRLEDGGDQVVTTGFNPVNDTFTNNTCYPMFYILNYNYTFSLFAGVTGPAALLWEGQISLTGDSIPNSNTFQPFGQDQANVQLITGTNEAGGGVLRAFLDPGESVTVNGFRLEFTNVAVGAPPTLGTNDVGSFSVSYDFTGFSVPPCGSVTYG